ncbi:hypothetical protein A5482_014725 (plasmid) [Cyanobacterium sp. IPPAS B-1200]|uniref:hypothetical protein n=1 Tax=Cyanobacterium sp. IPPAS B-1200 TaxID=1562720 RepID=UPI000852815C|nr:hypothetical protein [Cyanobacterium sp. IPPAS B-1200]OEJ78144.1 hypothetical protein A5482_13995 [Cyanobacterium sp. IPPAS B-1200]
MKNFKIVTQKKGKYRQKILTWQENGKQQRQNIPKSLWYLIDNIDSLEELLSALENIKTKRQPRERKSNRRVKGEGSGMIKIKYSSRKNKDGTIKRYTQHWFQYREDEKLRIKYIPVAMVDSIVEMNARKLPISVILERLN